MKNKIFIILLLPILFIIASCNNYAKNITLNIIEFNDIHGNILRDTKAGLSDASSKVNKIRDRDDIDNTILIANGDMFQGTAISQLDEGRVVIDAMNKMNFDMIGIGNHEFDWGLDSVLKYFDGDASNGEASFPLVNSNIFNRSDNKLVGIDYSNITDSLLIEKAGIKIGIISFVGDVYNSINYNIAKDYILDTEYEEIVKSLGAKLKNDGADLIIVNLHDGDTKGIEHLSANSTIANVKYNDKYLVDAIINGHTHTKQQGYIERNNGVSVPVVQSSGNLSSFGQIDLVYNKKKGVVSSTISNIDLVKTSKYDNNVENIISSYYDQNKSKLEEVYCQTSYISRYSVNFRNWASNLMMKAFNVTASIANTGAFRSNVEAGDFNYAKLYELNPFDNHVILTSINGADLKEFMRSNQEYYFMGSTEGYDYSDLDSSKVYTLAILDYVYFGTYFKDYRYNDYIDTKITLRDLMIEDLRCHSETGFNPDNDYNAYLSSKI